MHPCGDAFIDLGMGGSGVEEEAVCSKDAFKDRGTCEGGKVWKTWGKGVYRCDRGGGGCVVGED